MTTQIHDSTTCTAGFDGQPCVMCHFAREFEKSSSKSPSDASGTENQPAGFLESGGESQPQGILAQSSPISAPTPTPDFTREWDTAPRAYRRITEQECAEYFFERGRQARDRELKLAWNQELKAIACVVRERITR